MMPAASSGPSDGSAVTAGTPLRPAYAYTARGAVHYVEAGSGLPLLLFHATPGSHRAFHYLLPLLAAHFRTIAVDTPGYGNSAPAPGTPSIESMAQSMVELLDALSLPRAHLLGLHTGNKIAAAMAAQWPDRVDRVVLAGQTHSLIIDRATRDAAIRELVDHYFPRFAATDDGAHHLRTWLMAQADVQSLWWPQKLLSGARVASKDVEIAESMVIDHLLGWRSIVSTYEAIFAFDLTEAMRRIAAPTLILEMQTSDEAHFGAQSPALCAMMKRAQSIVLPDTDASVFRIRPDVIADAVLPFLAAR